MSADLRTRTHVFIEERVLNFCKTFPMNFENPSMQLGAEDNDVLIAVQ